MGRFETGLIERAIRGDAELIERLRQGLFDKEQEVAEAALFLNHCQIANWSRHIERGWKALGKSILADCMKMGRDLSHYSQLSQARWLNLYLEVFKAFRVKSVAVTKTFIEGETTKAEAAIEVLAKFAIAMTSDISLSFCAAVTSIFGVGGARSINHWSSVS